MYLKRENAGDQYVGRCASCLDQFEKSFGISPPYFDYSSLGELEQVSMKEKIQRWLKERIIEYEDVPAGTRVLIDFYLHQYAIIILISAIICMTNAGSERVLFSSIYHKSSWTVRK